MKFAYWDVRGWGQPIRHLLAYKEVQYEHKQYKYGLPESDPSSWQSEKFTLGLEFPNLPYLFDGDVKLTQTLAILRYLGRKFDLDAQNREEKRRVDLVEQQLNDLRVSWGEFCYAKDFAEKRDAYEENLLDKLKAYSEFLGDRSFFAGDRLTYVDFFAYEIFVSLVIFSKKSFAKFKNLMEYLDRISALSTLKAYLESEDFARLPFLTDEASFLTRAQTSALAKE